MMFTRFINFISRLRIDIRKLFLPNKLFLNGYFNRINGDIKHIFWSICGLFYDFVKLFTPNKIFINGFFGRKGPYIINNNWGDDINISLFGEFTNLNILPKNASRLYRILPVKNYICIGSILGLYDNPRLQVWGSGVISYRTKIKRPIGKIHSVRGPLTRDVLKRQGIDCPEVYGDPALLVSKFYTSSSPKKYRIGIIPHYIDLDNNYIKEFVSKRNDAIIISMKGYTNWRDIPDAVCSCDYIISSSLHGLIVSDSYGIPNAWVRFSDNITGGSFKYLDYFGSVDRDEKEPILINCVDDLQQIVDNKIFGQAKSIDFKSILNACPFKQHLTIKL